MLTRSQLHEYQRRTVAFGIDNPGAALWLDMGLGKTVSSLTAIRDMLEGFEIRRALVVAPLRVSEDVWQQEAARWDHLADLPVSVATGPRARRVAAIRADLPVTVINRENLPWLVRGFGRDWPYDMVVLDEASSFKSAKSQRWKAMRSVMPNIRRMLQLTATPASQSLDSLWSQAYLLDGGARLGWTQHHFRDRWMQPDYHGYNYEVRNQQCADEIYAALGDITLRLDAADYLQLPPLHEVDRVVQISDAARKDYERIERELVLTLQRGDTQHDVEAANAAVLAGKLQQIANGHAYDVDGNAVRIHEAKLHALAELREETDEPLLVAYAFREDERLLRARFQDAVSISEPNAVERWNRGEISMLLAHPDSAGHGLNLQGGGALLVWYGLTWSAEKYKQTYGRLWRQGQTRPVTIVRLLAANTIDTRIAARVHDSMEQEGRLLDALRAMYL